MIDVSVVSGTLNRLPLLQTLLGSIRVDLQGSGLTYEIIIVDGGSTDGTLEYLRRQTDIQLIQQGQPLGSMKAFDAGFAQARGRYVVNLNDDAMIHPPVIPPAVKLLDADAEIGQVAIPYRNPSPDDRIYVREILFRGVLRVYANFGVTRKELGDRLGWWRSDLYKQYGGDTHLSWAIWKAGLRAEPLLSAGYVEHFESQDTTRRTFDPSDTATFFGLWNQT